MKTTKIDYQTEESSISFEGTYFAPLIEVVEVSVEKGFADSSEDFEDGTW